MPTAVPAQSRFAAAAFRWQRCSWIFGELVCIWRLEPPPAGLWELCLPGRAPRGLPPAAALACRPPAALREAVAVVHRQLDHFPVAPLPLNLLTGRERLSLFAWRVLECLAAVPPGRVLGYGALAARAGHPGAARAVGRVMAANPWPLFFPCHRVILADGLAGGYGGGRRLKRQLLQAEGVVFDAAGRVSPASRLA